MTTQTWDNTEIGRDFAHCKTLVDIINSIESTFSRRGEVICEIRVDGQLLDEGDERKFGEDHTRQIRALEIRANRPEDLIRDAIASTLVFIPDLEKATLEAAEKLRSSEVREGYRAFSEVLQGCQWLVDTLTHVRGAASGTTQPIQHPERWFSAQKLTTGVVRELTEACEKKDSVLLADLMEYELTGVLDIWQEAIGREAR